MRKQVASRLRKICFFILLIFGATSLFAQTNHISETPPVGATINATKFLIFINGGTTFPFTDIKKSIPKPLFDIGAGYRMFPYLQINIALQKGWLSAGPKTGSQPFFKNNFWAENLKIRFMPFKLAGSDKIKNALYSGLYLGAGLEILQSQTVSRPQPPDWGALQDYQGTDLFLPAEIGASIPLVSFKHSNPSAGNQLLLNLNYCNYFGFGDKIDGYVPQVQHNQHLDSFGTLTLGLICLF